MRLIPNASVRCEIYEQKYLDQCLAVTFRQTISHVHFMSCVLWGPNYLTTFTEHLLCEWHMHGPVDMQRNEVLPLLVSKRQEGPSRVWVSSIDSSPGLSPLKRTADPLCNISDRSHGFWGAYPKSRTFSHYLGLAPVTSYSLHYSD